MKKTKLPGLILSFLLAGGISFADMNFSGMAGGSAGIAGTISDTPEFNMPFNGFAAAQLNFGSWGIFRANLGLATKNLADGNIFTGQDATLKINELSFVLLNSGNQIKNYFGFYFGTYEVVGQDEFLQRQFGIEPFTSLVTKNATTLSTGIPLYNNYGAGFSYVMNFAKAPGALGFNLYFNESESSVVKMNFDIRTAWATKIATLDFSAGIGTPLQNNNSGDDVILLIDTIYFHGGISVLLGSLYTHSLFLQAGIQNIAINKGGIDNSFDPVKDITLLVEPRIYTKKLKTRLTAYSLPKETITNMFYLHDTLGAVATVYSDTIPVKNNNMTLGIHVIGSLPDKSIVDLVSENVFENSPEINAFVTPFLSFPVADGEMEIMAQLGAMNLINDLSFSYQAKIGYKKAF